MRPFQIRPLLTVRAAAAATVIAVLALLGPSTAFAAYTMQHTQTGAILRAGPTASGVSTSPGGGGFGGGPPNGSTNRFGGPPGGAPNQSGGFGSPPNGSARPTPPSGSGGGFGSPPSGRSFGGGGPGSSQVSSTLITYLEEHRGSAKYIVATPSSNGAAPIIIATGLPVMSLGGFTGSDPILTTAKLASLAKAGEIRYFLLDGGGQGGPGGGNGLTSWIQAHSRSITVGGTQLYEYTG